MPRDAAVTRDRILKAAHRMFFRRGYARVTMDEIAREARLTKRTLYHHYESKDALLEAMLEHQHDLTAQTYARIVEETDGGAEAFVARLFDDLETTLEDAEVLLNSIREELHHAARAGPAPDLRAGRHLPHQGWLGPGAIRGRPPV